MTAGHYLRFASRVPSSTVLRAIALRVAGTVLGVMLCAGPAGAQGLWPMERPPRPLAPREVKFPPYEIRTLANGMQVITVLHHEQPAVSVRLLVRTGSLHDPRGKVGVARLAASLLDQGTATKTAEQIADHIDFIGGAIATGSTPDLTFVNVVVMKDSFDVAMDLLADVVRNPAFSPEEIDRQKQQVISSLQVNRNDPDYVASVLFDRLVYGFHPYGLPSSGTPETLAAITREDLREYHRRHFVPNNMVLAVVGDVTAEEALAAAERVFGTWPRADLAPVKTIEPPPPTRRVVVVDMPDAVQTEIRVGQLAIPRKHPDYMAFDLAVKILGGEGANRLHRVLRSERGLTYGAAADTGAWKEAGDFVAETDTRTDTTAEALRLTIDEFSRLLRERVSVRELADAQAYLAGSFPLTIETPNDIATQVLNVVFYELPVEEIGTFPERVQAVTPDDIQRVARQYVKPDRLSIVLVGNAAAFTSQLRGVGFTDFEVIPVDQLDLLSATLKREAARVAAVAAPHAAVAGASARSVQQCAGRGRSVVETAQAVSCQFAGQVWAPHAAYSVHEANPRAGSAVAATAVAPAAPADTDAIALLERVVDAKGGLEALKNVRTVVADAETTFQMEQGTMTSTTRTYVSYPDRFRVDATLPGQKVVQVFNAGDAWVSDPAGVRAAPPAMRDQFAASVRRDTIPMLIAAVEGSLTVRSLSEHAHEGRLLQVVEISGDRLEAVTLYIDTEHRIVRQAFSTAGPDGRPVEATEVFSDYRPVDGVQVPFKADLLHNGQPILSRTLTRVTFNGRVSDELFVRPQ